MPNLLIRSARCVATLDHADPTRARELPNTSIYMRDHRIAYIGPTAGVPVDLGVERHNAFTIQLALGV